MYYKKIIIKTNENKKPNKSEKGRQERTYEQPNIEFGQGNRKVGHLILDGVDWETAGETLGTKGG